MDQCESDRTTFVKERQPAPAGSIPDLLEMFGHEVRFYQEIAPEVGVRVPKCYDASRGGGASRLVLEDLSHWSVGADPVLVAGLLKGMHARWQGEAERGWPWLRRVGRAADRAADAIGALYERVWSEMKGRPDITPAVERLGSRLVGRIPALEREEARSPTRTLIHGDASLRNTFRSADGETAFVDWEDVRTANGSVDLAWLLVSSVEPRGWDPVIAAYSPEGGDLVAALPTAVGQGILSLSACEEESADALGWVRRLDAAAARLKGAWS